MSADQTVVLDVTGKTLPFADTRRVDGEDLFPVDFETQIDAVTSRPGNLADDDSFFLSQSVDERALADVSAADNRQLHFRFFIELGSFRAFVLGGGWKVLQDRIHQIMPIAVAFDARRHDVAVDQRIELSNVIVEFF